MLLKSWIIFKELLQNFILLTGALRAIVWIYEQFKNFILKNKYTCEKPKLNAAQAGNYSPSKNMK